MNKKLTAKNNFGKTVFCVLSSEADYEEQLMKLFGFDKGQGFSVDFTEKEIIIKDYFVSETVGRFEVISFEDTDLQVNLNWVEV